MDGFRDILETRESLRRPLMGSLGLHAGAALLIAVLGVANFAKHEPWGDPNARGGGAVGVTAVKSIPIAGHEGPVNRVANDSKSQVPEPVTKPEPKTRAAEREAEDAIPLKSRHPKRSSAADTYRNPRTNPSPLSDNQLTSRVGQSASSQLFAPSPGSGGVGVGNGTPFGVRFGAYAALIQDRVASKWRTDQVDARIRSLPTPAIVTFDIQRNGQVRNVRVAQSSGNVALDYSAQRAVMEAAPFEPLPAAYSGSSATIEFWFTLKR